MRIPNENRWTQTNDGDIFGALHESHNLFMDKLGTLRLNHKSVAHENEATDFEQIHDIEQYGGNTYLITDDLIFSGDLDGSQFTAVGSSPVLDTRTSAVVAFGNIYVTDGGTVDYYNGSWTTNVITGLNNDSGVANPLAFFESLASHQLAIGNKTAVNVYNSSHSNGTNLSIPTDLIVTTLAYRNGYLYVGTKSEDGREALVFMWNGSGSAAQFSIPVGASWIYALVPYGNSVAGLTNEGELFGINGSQKITLGFLPIFTGQGARWYSGNAAVLGKVSHNGLCVIGDNIYMMVEGDVDTGFVEGMYDGVWCYDPRIGIYHYSTPTTDTVVEDGSLTRSGNTLTTSAAHSLKTGDAIQFTGVSALSGVSTDTVYYAINVSSTELQIAASRYDANAGNALTLSGTPGAADKLTYTPNTDYGTILTGRHGALMPTNHRVGMLDVYASDIIYGAEPKNTSDSIISTVQALSDVWNVGWFTTQKMYTNQVAETWQDVTVFMRGNLLSNESIVVKYKVEDREGLPTRYVSCTWSDSDTLTTTDLAVNDGIAEVGDEVMIVSGKGQGRLAHITAISESSGTVTISIDETIGNASDACRLIVTGFQKAGTITGGSRPNNGYVTIALNKVSPWIQIKVEMRGYGIEVPMLELVSKTNKIAR